MDLFLVPDRVVAAKVMILTSRLEPFQPLSLQKLPTGLALSTALRLSACGGELQAMGSMRESGDDKRGLGGGEGNGYDEGGRGQRAR